MSDVTLVVRVFMDGIISPRDEDHLFAGNDQISKGYF